MKFFEISSVALPHDMSFIYYFVFVTNRCVSYAYQNSKQECEQEAQEIGQSNRTQRILSWFAASRRCGENLHWKDGDFLVRYTEVDRHKSFVVSAQWNARPHYLVISKKGKNKYTLERKQFSTISDMVRQHWQKLIPIGQNKILLKTPVTQQDWGVETR